MLYFLVATYNEEEEIDDLLSSIYPWVDRIIVSDDGSDDRTLEIASLWTDFLIKHPHTASCELTRLRGFSYIPEYHYGITDDPEDNWVLILDADERISEDHLKEISEWLDFSDEAKQYSHVYFSQDEYIDGQLTRSFAKIKLAKVKDLHLPEGIHQDIQCDGEGINKGWKVIHRKTSEKQKMREREYLAAYEKEIAEGRMTRERADQVTSWHYFEKSL